MKRALDLFGFNFFFQKNSKADFFALIVFLILLASPFSRGEGTPNESLSKIVENWKTQWLPSGLVLSPEKSLKAFFDLEGNFRKDEVQDLCDFLTNDDRQLLSFDKTPRRKELFKDLNRKVCEALEHYSLDGKKSFSETGDLIFFLVMMKDSFENRARAEAGVGFLQIMEMGWHHTLSPFRLRYEFRGEGRVSDPPNSLLWKKLKNSEERKAEFDRQLQEKKISGPPEWVVFEEADGQGSVPKVHVKDLFTDEKWLLKWGDEVHTDPVASRLFAALGFNVDHPFFCGRDSFYLILPKNSAKIRSIRDFVRMIKTSYDVNLSPFISRVGRVDSSMVRAHNFLSPFEGRYYMTFRTAAIEPRPKVETRLGGFAGELSEIASLREARGSLLAHLWLGSWDTKTDNTLLTLVQTEDGVKLRGSFSDLGVSLGVRLNRIPRDLKAGLVNEYELDFIEKSDQKIKFNSHMNSWQKMYREAETADLRWMAQEIAELDEGLIQTIVSSGGWPEPLHKIFFEKIMERRRQILVAFGLSSQEKPRVTENETRLNEEISLEEFPEGFFRPQGRFRGYGW